MMKKPDQLSESMEVMAFSDYLSETALLFGIQLTDCTIVKRESVPHVAEVMGQNF